MEELIKQAFLHVDVIGPHVQEGHYDLVGPDGEIILPQIWETIVQPDWAITMHMWPSTQRSPPGAFPPLSATSPISTHSDISQDPFRQGTFQFLNNRRPSQASENASYPSGLPSASTGDSYPSSDSFSPASQVTPIEGHCMSIDGAVNRKLPPPTGPLIQHIPPHGVGGFKCEHPGCSAAPFQTQYLLK